VRVDPFKAADGFRFYLDEDPCVLHGGRYSNGNGALYVTTDAGEALDKLTVNLVDEKVEPDEFFIPVTGAREGRSARWRIQRTLLQLGIFEQTKRFAGSGFVEEYGQLWRFGKLFPAGEHVYRVADPVCRKVLADAYEAKRMELASRESVDRLQGREPRPPKPRHL